MYINLQFPTAVSPLIFGNFAFQNLNFVGFQSGVQTPLMDTNMNLIDGYFYHGYTVAFVCNVS